MMTKLIGTLTLYSSYMRRKSRREERRNGGRIEAIPHRFMHLNTWFPAVSTVAVGLGGMSLIDKTGYWGQAL